MPEDQETPKPRPPGPEPGDSRQPLGAEPGDPGRPPGPEARDSDPKPEPRHPDPNPDRLQKAGDRFTQLSLDLIDAVNTSGGFEPGGHNASLRSVLRATTDNFAAGASAFSEITRAGIASGRLTDEDVELIAEIETWAAHFRMVTLTIQRALGDPPEQTRVDGPRAPQVDEPAPPR
jgi:hypothetical protein